MFGEMTRYWWVLALRGAFAVLFGVLAFAWPGVTLSALVLLFGAYALVDGVFALVHAAAGGAGVRWPLALEGLVGVLAGLGTLAWPEITALALLYLIAAWAIVTGLLEVVGAIRLRRVIDDEWLLGLSGLASVVFGVLLVLWPGAGALAVVWLIGSYAVVFGVLVIALAFRLRSIGQPVDGSAAPSPLGT